MHRLLFAVFLATSLQPAYAERFLCQTKSSYSINDGEISNDSEATKSVSSYYYIDTEKEKFILFSSVNFEKPTSREFIVNDWKKVPGGYLLARMTSEPGLVKVEIGTPTRVIAIGLGGISILVCTPVDSSPWALNDGVMP